MEKATNLEEFLKEQDADSECQAAVQAVGCTASSFHDDRNGILIRKSPIDCTLQKVVLVTPRARIL